MKIINKEENAFHLTPKLGGLSLYHPDPIWLKLKTFPLPLIAFPIQQFKAAIPHSLCKDLGSFYKSVWQMNMKEKLSLWLGTILWGEKMLLAF